MTDNKIDINLYILKIRQLAGRHQTGENLNIIINKVDNLIGSFEERLGIDDNYQVAKWTELSGKLKVFDRNTFDSRWMVIIYHAKKLINCKKHRAVRRQKKRKG